MSDDGTLAIEMPAMGESVTEGTVLEWHVAEGDEVSEGDTIVEVSTDKVDAEVPAPASGTITKILKGEDEDVKVGEALAEMAAGENGASAPSSVEEANHTAEADGTHNHLVEGTGEGDADLGGGPDPTTAQHGEESGAGGNGSEGAEIEIAMPEMGESVTEGTVLEYRVAVGDTVAEGDTIVEVSTDKVDAEVPAPAAGTITELLKAEDDTVQVGEALARMTAGDGAAPTAPSGGDAGSATGSAAPADTASAVDETGRATPLARRIAAARGVDLGSLKGTGEGGKVTKEDVLAAGNGAGTAVATEVGRLKGPAATLAKAMDESRSIPTATSFRTLAVDTIWAKRKALNGALADRGMQVSFTHLIAWAIVEAGRTWRVMSRSFVEQEGKPHVVESETVNLGIAVDVERKDGSRALMVPCIRGADTLDFAGFHSYYEDLVRKTRENSLTADDFVGTNITLTNPGGIGTVASVPRLMTGQGTIVATGSIAYPPEWSHVPADKLKALGVSRIMTMTSTYDHRIIQGAESGNFLKAIDELLQGEHDFYERVAADLGVQASVVATAHPESASAPPLAAASTAQAPASAGAVSPGQVDEELLQGVQAATSLLKAYRTHGHLAATLNPLGGDGKGDPALEPENLNLTPDLMGRIPASILRIGVEGETLLDALPRMREAYCGNIAYQFEHLSSHQQRMWLREMIETGGHRTPLSADEKRSLLTRLIEVFQFERFVQKAYLGQKVFSIEGLDVVVPMIDSLVTHARAAGAEEVVIGMAHRGRLSVLAHNLGRSAESIMAEFEGAKALDRVKAIAAIPHSGTGDVKYHHGAEGIFTAPDGEEIRVRMYPNPSHLEFVDPVVTGGARAAQTEHSGPRLHHNPHVAVPLLLHGDAAFPGQGIVAETLNLSRLCGWDTGGTIHIIVNNQLGFTADARDSYSTSYASGLARGFKIPIVHVNADDPVACVEAARLAIAYRNKFQRDFLIDLIGYRRWGHNEGDEPAFTQPLMYQKIASHPTVRDIWARTLVERGIIDASVPEALTISMPPPFPIEIVS